MRRLRHVSAHEPRRDTRRVRAELRQRMVKARHDQPTLADGRLDLDGTVNVLCMLDATIDRSRLTHACEFLRSRRNGEALLSVGLAFGVLIAELELGTDAVIAAVVYRAVHGKHLEA